MILSLCLPAAIPAALFLLQEQTEHAAKFLGIPLPIWQILNLVLFLAVLTFAVAKPMAAAFRKRQMEIEERGRQAEKQRAEVERLSHEIRERTERLEREIEEIRRQGIAEGESARAALSQRAKEEAQRVRQETGEEIERRLAAAKAQLRQAAADLTSAAASEIVSREVTEEDRRKFLTESVSRMKASR
ncbi:MAG: ATP synthase F0 subunit B [Acidobacteriota bacterium]